MFPADPTAPARRNRQILTDCSVRAVIADTLRAGGLRSGSEAEMKVNGVLQDLRSCEGTPAENEGHVLGPSVYPLHLRLDGKTEGSNAHPFERTHLRR